MELALLCYLHGTKYNISNINIAVSSVASFKYALCEAVLSMQFVKNTLLERP